MGKKEDYFKEAVAPEVMVDLRQALREAEAETIPTKAQEIRLKFTQFTPASLLDYSRMVYRATDETFQAYIDKKIATGTLAILARWERDDQNFMLKEFFERKMTPSQLQKVRRVLDEQGCGFDEAISKAMGAMPMHQPREQKPRSFDTVLDEINKHSAKWRGLMSMALDLIGEEEAKAGVHSLLFQRAYLLRHTIKENYDFANSKVNRYFNFIKKKYKAAAETSSQGPEFTEGDPDGNRAGPGEKGLDREAGADVEDGSPLPDQSGESESEGRVE